MIGGRYLLESALGRGGFGSVFRGKHLGSGQPVAIKLLSREALNQRDARTRFDREAALAMGLRHPSTVRVLDTGDAGDGTPFIVFELLVGCSLEERLSVNALPLDKALSIAMDVLGSLQEAHEQQIVHRDVKPANVLLCSEPAKLVKLLDFGVAKSAVSGEQLTAQGAMVGTPVYMAPEQIRAAVLGPGTDLFALGLVLAEMLTKEAVYQGTALAICTQKLTGRPAEFRSPLIPLSLMAVLRRATALELADRYKSAEEMRRALAATGLLPRPASSPPAQPGSGLHGTQIMLRKDSSPQLMAALAATHPTPQQRPASSPGLAGLAATIVQEANPMANTVPQGHNAALVATMRQQAGDRAPRVAPQRPKAKARRALWLIGLAVLVALATASGVVAFLKLR